MYIHATNETLQLDEISDSFDIVLLRGALFDVDAKSPFDCLALKMPRASLKPRSISLY